MDRSFREERKNGTNKGARMTKRRFTLFFCIMFWIAPSVPAQEPGGAVDLALCLDTSSSMSGPLDAARMQLWEIVNELALLEPTPRLRVALLSYGNPVNDPARGWVRLETPLTEDLDLVSQRLFDLTSDGGDEYVARAIKIAVEELEWSESDNALKMILIAGNEAAYSAVKRRRFACSTTSGSSTPAASRPAGSVE